MSNIVFSTFGEKGVLARHHPTGLAASSTTQETVELNKAEAESKLKDLIAVAQVKTDMFDEFGGEYVGCPRCRSE